MNKPLKLKLPNYNINIRPIRTVRPKSESNNKVLSKLTYALCFKTEDGEFRARVNTNGLEGYKESLCCEFSEESYNLEDKTTVFYKNPDEHGRYTKVLRTIVDAKFYPGSPVTYTPFCENHVYSGYLVKRNGSLYFKVSEYMGYVKQFDLLLTCNINDLKSTKTKVDSDLNLFQE